MTGAEGGRRAARRAAVILLYQHDLTDLPLTDLRENARQDSGSPEDPYTTMLVDGALLHRVELDLRIDEAATGWSVERLGMLERAILRVATWEILHCPGTPEAVAVNEAVELAKRYCGSEAPAFVNGILARIVNQKEGTG